MAEEPIKHPITLTLPAGAVLDILQALYTTDQEQQAKITEALVAALKEEFVAARHNTLVNKGRAKMAAMAAAAPGGTANVTADTPINPHDHLEDSDHALLQSFEANLLTAVNTVACSRKMCPFPPYPCCPDGLTPLD